MHLSVLESTDSGAVRGKLRKGLTVGLLSKQRSIETIASISIYIVYIAERPFLPLSIQIQLGPTASPYRYMPSLI